MAQKRGGDGGDGLRRERRGGLLQSESPSDSAGRQTGFLIGEPIGRSSPETYPRQRQTLQHWLSTRGAIAIVLPSKAMNIQLHPAQFLCEATDTSISHPVLVWAVLGG